MMHTRAERRKTATPFTRGNWYVYLASYFMNNRLLGRRQPLLAGMKVTHGCNLKCIHCPFWKRDQRTIPYHQGIRSLEALRRLGVGLLIFEGGEPFQWKDGGYDIRDLVGEAKKRFFCVGLTTNGTYPLDVDSDIIWVSLDGLRETHNRLRCGSFDRIISNIQSSSHPNLYAHMTISSLNWREIPDMVVLFSGLVRGITFQFYYPYQETEEGLFLPWAERKIVLDRLIDLKSEGYPIEVSYNCMEALKTNSWKCRPWMIANVDPDGRLTHGCYIKNRGDVSCGKCGFSAHTEISLAYNGSLESFALGNRVFHSRRV